MKIEGVESTSTDFSLGDVSFISQMGFSGSGHVLTFNCNSIRARVVPSCHPIP